MLSAFLVLSIGVDAALIIVSIAVCISASRFLRVCRHRGQSGRRLAGDAPHPSHDVLASGRAGLHHEGTLGEPPLVFGVALIAVIALLVAVLAVLTLVATRHPERRPRLVSRLPAPVQRAVRDSADPRRLARRPSLTGPLPPLEVIMPAYNEARDHRKLFAIDRAAACYGGSVRVVVGDDGSTDDTVSVVESAIRRFSAASGQITHIPHRGKAFALNAALAQTTADIVIRIDADVIVDPKALAGVPRWFCDPTVGTVGAFMMPDPRAAPSFTGCAPSNACSALASSGFPVESTRSPASPAPLPRSAEGRRSVSGASSPG